MTEQAFHDFLGALGEEFTEALSPPVAADLISPQAGYEVWRRAFGRDPSPALLAALSEPQLARLRIECERYFECAGVSIEQLRRAVSRTLARWPAEPA